MGDRHNCGGSHAVDVCARVASVRAMLETKLRRQGCFFRLLCSQVTEVANRFESTLESVGTG